jgi:hypothetical protein
MGIGQLVQQDNSGKRGNQAVLPMIQILSLRVRTTNLHVTHNFLPQITVYLQAAHM